MPTNKMTQNGSFRKPNYEDWYKTVPSDRNDTSSYNLRRAYELAPWEELEAWRNSSVQDLEAGKNHLRSVYENPQTGEYEFMKSKNHPTVGMELDWYNGNTPDAVNFRNNYDLDTSGEYYRYMPKVQTSATPVQQPYNIFRNIQLPNVSVMGTNKMNIGSVAPQVGAPNGNVGNVPLVNQQTAQKVMEDAATQQQQAKQAYEDTQAMIAATQKSAIPQTQPATPDPTLAQKAFEQGAADQMAGRYVQQNPQGVSVVPPIAEPTGNGNVPYIDAFNQLQEQKKKEVPKAKDGGKGLTTWIKNNLGGDGTKEGNRRAVQNIIALGNLLRHAANLRGTIHEATPQQIADQNAINEAKWKQEDALEQAQAEKQRQYELKLRQMQDAQRNADRNYDLNKRKADNDEKYKQEQQRLAREKNEREKELHAPTLAAKTAGAEKAKTDAEKAKLELKNLPEKQKAELAKIRAQINASNASAAHQRELTKKAKKENSGSEDYIISGHQGSFSRKKQASQGEKLNILDRAHRLGLISDADWQAIHNKTSWNSDGESWKADDLIAKLVNYGGENEYIRDIFESNGYTYHPYVPLNEQKGKVKVHLKH